MPRRNREFYLLFELFKAWHSCSLHKYHSFYALNNIKDLEKFKMKMKHSSVPGCWSDFENSYKDLFDCFLSMLVHEKKCTTCKLEKHALFLCSDSVGRGSCLYLLHNINTVCSFYCFKKKQSPSICCSWWQTLDKLYSQTGTEIACNY